MSTSLLVFTIIFGVTQAFWGIITWLMKDKMNGYEIKFTKLFDFVDEMRRDYATKQESRQHMEDFKDENKEAHKDLRQDINKLERRVLNGKE